jgi:hypothetical protein
MSFPVLLICGRQGMQSSQASRVLTVKQNRMLKKVTSAIMYCQENRELLLKYYMEIV